MFQPSFSRLTLATNLAPIATAHTLRVALTGTDRLARVGLISILRAYDDLDLDELESDERIASRLRVAEPDVILGVGATPELLEALRNDHTPAVILVNDANAASEAIGAGARGVLMRTGSAKTIHAALLAAVEGLTVVDDAFADRVLAHPHTADPLIEPLTARELEVMHLLASGLTNKEIAHRLGISDHTVKFHVNGILGKLGVETRTEAVVHAARLGIVVL